MVRARNKYKRAKRGKRWSFVCYLNMARAFDIRPVPRAPPPPTDSRFYGNRHRVFKRRRFFAESFPNSCAHS